eukprot:scaffold81_cov115-Isochrysis_galbana.AAC.3
MPNDLRERQARGKLNHEWVREEGADHLTHQKPSSRHGVAPTNNQQTTTRRATGHGPRHAPQ